ncbi:MAG: T9SS type A sorting domain-containing protein [Bacteroidetes bacterium]|nr:MAG: T9SS type A sorting domain-containing protein [Bacteroidota bacterium]
MNRICRLCIPVIFLLALFSYNLFAGSINSNYILSADADKLFDIKNIDGKSYISFNSLSFDNFDKINKLTIRFFPMYEGNNAELELIRTNSIIDGNTKFLTNTLHGEIPINPPKISMFTGTINGNKNEKAYLFFIDNYIFGTIIKDDIIQYIISPKLNSNLKESMIANVNDYKFQNEIAGCLNDKIEQFSKSNKFNGIDKPLTNELLEVELAVETDTEFFKNTGSNLSLAQAYTIAIFSMVNAIYEEQLNISIKISWLKNWTDNPADPYDVKGNAYALPDKVRQYWKDNYSNVQRDVFHVMTSVSYGGGGYGYFDALCNNKEYGFSVSSVQASHSFPILAFNYDVYIVAHELGHNFNGQHTHSCYFGAPIDTCLTADAINGGCLDSSITPKPNPGSIMSYCGGTNNQFGLGYQVKMVFDPQNAVLMRSIAEKAICLSVPSIPSIAILNPYGNQSFNYGDSILIKWNSSGVNTLGIEYSINNGASWEQIIEPVNASEKQYVLVAPKICSDNVKLRLYSMEDSTVADTSIIPFSIFVKPNDDLLAFYPFNGNASNAVCGGFLDGIPVNNPRLVPDRFGNQNSAFHFSNGNYIWIPDADFNHKELTVSFWFNADSLKEKMFFIGTNSGPALNVFEIYHWGQLGCSYYLNVGLYQCWSGRLPPANKWNHAAFTYDGDTAKVYVNGTLTKVEYKPGKLLNFTTTLYIGSRKGNEPFSGAIDDIYIFKKALGEEEIVSLYNENSSVPAKPELLFPTNYLMIDTSFVTFTWNNITNAVNYHIQLSVHNDMDSYPLIINDSLIRDTTYNFNVLHNGSSYYWRVRADNYFGNSQWSEIFNFIYDSLNSVSDNFYEPEIEIVPVPASEKLNLKITNFYHEDIDLSLFDEYGRIILTRSIPNINSDILNCDFDISKIISGVYFLKIQSRGLVKVKKIIKIK